MKKLYILSKHEVNYFEKERKTYVIRIEDNEGQLNDLPFEPEGLLSLYFHDISLQVIHSNINIPDNWIIFNDNLANKLINFLDSISLEEDIDVVIHCYAGFSRSSAVALVLAWYFNKQNIEKSILNSHYTPNTLVLSIMNKKLNFQKDFIINNLTRIK